MKYNSKTIADILEDEDDDFVFSILLYLEEQNILTEKILYKKMNKKELKNWYMLVACYRLTRMLNYKNQNHE